MLWQMVERVPQCQCFCNQIVKLDSHTVEEAFALSVRLEHPCGGLCASPPKGLPRYGSNIPGIDIATPAHSRRESPSVKYIGQYLAAPIMLLQGEDLPLHRLN